MEHTTIAVIVVVIFLVILLFMGSGASILSPAAGGLRKAKAQALRRAGVSYMSSGNVPHHFGQSSFQSAASKKDMSKKGKKLPGHKLNSNKSTLHKSKLNTMTTKSNQVF